VTLHATATDDRLDVLASDPALRAVVAGPARPIALADLLNDLGTLVRLLHGALSAGDLLDAFLLAAGAQQIVEDRLGGQRRLTLRRAAGHLGGRPGLVPRTLGRALRAVDAALVRLGSWRRLGRALAREADATTDFLVGLAHALLGDPPGQQEMARLQRQGRELVSRLGELAPALAGEVVRLPSCFRSFDQRPADVVAMVTTFASRWPERSRPISVVGLRTSGGYLAPLCSAALERLGYASVTTMTVRPGWPLRRRNRALLGATAEAGGMVLVLDDPPATGKSIARVVKDLGRDAGIPSESVVLLLATFAEEASLPALVDCGASVLLPRSAWDVERLLQPACVARTLAGLLPEGSVVHRVESLGEPHRPVRGHVSARYRVETSDAVGDTVRTETIVAEGVGLGYLGRHALAVAESAPELYPDVLGVENGICYRRFLPEAWRLDGTRPAPATADRLAAHVVRRERALRVEEDRSTLLSGRQPAWEIAADLVARTLGPLGVPLRLPLVDPVVRRLLAVEHPTVVDGSTARGGWFLSPTGPVARRTDFAEGPFSHFDLASYDAAFDLAGATVAVGDPRFAARLRSSYESLAGRSIDAERWMLLRLVHLWDAERLELAAPAMVRRAGARVLQEYVAERFLRDLAPVEDGPTCALDLDGVLETGTLGFSATTLAGAMALRALRAHGYRVVLATGRSLGEVIERCAAYGLAGGVAEYGSVAYDHLRGESTELVASGDEAAVEALRAALRGQPELTLDGDYPRIVRVSRTRAGRTRRGLDAETVAGLLETPGTGDRLTAIPGEYQTDFAATGVSKDQALCVLLDQLDGAGGVRRDPGHRLELAVGDGRADVGMLRLARLGLAPANADEVMRRSGASVLRRSYQAGLGDAVGRLLGHRPGSCPACRLPALTPDARELLALVSVQEGGRRGAPGRLLGLAAGAVRGLWRT